ncbi:hypothetical protein SKAU_G00009060 [Synaphobranchus kaupii]|uniref:Uncharacterized protein n=1 Tax=Synaphobranchus kaupii TaxID=118154 RepID=A0A9Q1JBZ9_SYNKA|nr:hypothetical protein SKAU_G00009060 [Synaphobranchus kaupii]
MHILASAAAGYLLSGRGRNARSAERGCRGPGLAPLDLPRMAERAGHQLRTHAYARRRRYIATRNGGTSISLLKQKGRRFLTRSACGALSFLGPVRAKRLPALPRQRCSSAPISAPAKGMVKIGGCQQWNIAVQWKNQEQTTGSEETQTVTANEPAVGTATEA